MKEKDLYPEGKLAKDFENESPQFVRELIEKGSIIGPTSGMCNGFAQANLVILPQKYAFDFLLFAMRNPRSCPILEVTEPGVKLLKTTANNADITKVIPKYRIFKNGILEEEVSDIGNYWRDDLVSFLIGCSFSFESELLSADVPVRQIEENCNVPMYNLDSRKHDVENRKSLDFVEFYGNCLVMF